MPQSDMPQVSESARATLSDDEFWNLKIVRSKTGLSRSTIYAYIATGAFPAQRRLGRRRVAWLSSEVKVWITSRPRQPAQT